ncbi:MAG: hypothetical protein GTO24_27060 [candidate division Zixibacteria bacterium]|nr:hypothetical protein [candidate division Zixibacteria bacterium]
MRILRGILSCLFSGFIFRPFMFFILPGFALLILSIYPLTWALIHTVTSLRNVPASGEFFDAGLSAAVRSAFVQSPHSFLVGGVALMVALQLITLGVISLQNKRYFEELFHLGTSIFRNDQRDKISLAKE